MSYSETLRAVAPTLASHHYGYEILQALAASEKADPEDAPFRTADVVYWLGANCHGGQMCPLYAALCVVTHTCKFSPGQCAYGPSCPEGETLLAELEGIVIQ